MSHSNIELRQTEDSTMVARIAAETIRAIYSRYYPAGAVEFFVDLHNEMKVEKVMTEHFGKDTVIALATVEKGIPHVRYVNAYYENGAFYVITYALSNKIKHMENNPVIAIAGEWFTAHGKGINLGYFGKEENHRIAKRLKEVFSE